MKESTFWMIHDDLERRLLAKRTHSKKDIEYDMFVFRTGALAVLAHFNLKLHPLHTGILAKDKNHDQSLESTDGRGPDSR
jgi:hypothetical protein